jgi:hypothetical protein
VLHELEIVELPFDPPMKICGLPDVHGSKDVLPHLLAKIKSRQRHANTHLKQSAMNLMGPTGVQRSILVGRTWDLRSSIGADARPPSAPYVSQQIDPRAPGRDDQENEEPSWRTLWSEKPDDDRQS